MRGDHGYNAPEGQGMGHKFEGSMTKQALSIVGASRRNGERDPLDFYPTPAYATEALFLHEHFSGNVWEPACGNGAISRVLTLKGLHTYSSDITDRGFGEDRKCDFLNSARKVDNIITNPPFNLALEFVEHGKKMANKKIAMFLKTTFLESEKRYDMFNDLWFPLKCMYQFSKRVRLDKNGIPMEGKSGMIAFAWFVWDKEYIGKPYIEWIV